jgi:hypothetical protein
MNRTQEIARHVNPTSQGIAENPWPYYHSVWNGQELEEFARRIAVDCIREVADASLKNCASNAVVSVTEQIIGNIRIRYNITD